MSGVATTPTAAPAERRAAQPRERDGWLAALQDLYAIPVGYRAEDVDRIGALGMLRCGEEILEELISRGLPCSGRPGAERFDRHDLFNLALYSGSGHSIPERVVPFALRWMSRAPQTWFEPLDWAFSAEIGAAEQWPGRGTPVLSLARPTPEAFGGAVTDLVVAPAHASVGEADIEVEAPSLTVRAQVRTGGERRELASPRLRALAAEFLAERYRWVKLPESLQRRPDLVLPHRVAPCITASLHLAPECAAAGYEVRTRRGWIMGMLDHPHSWVEVVDDDGVVKAIDPVFAMLATLAEDPHPDFAAACLGSPLNRTLPTAHSADQPLITHRYGDVPAIPRSRISVRMLRTEPAGAVPTTGERNASR